MGGGKENEPSLPPILHQRRRKTHLFLYSALALWRCCFLPLLSATNMHTYCIGARTFTFRVPHCYYGRPACASSSPSHVSASAWRRKKKKTARWRECLFFSLLRPSPRARTWNTSPPLSPTADRLNTERGGGRGGQGRGRERERGRRSERGGGRGGVSSRKRSGGWRRGGRRKGSGGRRGKKGPPYRPPPPLSVRLSLPTAAIFDGWAAASPARSRRMKSNNRGAESPPPLRLPSSLSSSAAAGKDFVRREEVGEA